MNSSNLEQELEELTRKESQLQRQLQLKRQIEYPGKKNHYIKSLIISFAIHSYYFQEYET